MRRMFFTGLVVVLAGCGAGCGGSGAGLAGASGVSGGSIGPAGSGSAGATGGAGGRAGSGMAGSGGGAGASGGSGGSGAMGGAGGAGSPGGGGRAGSGTLSSMTSFFVTSVGIGARGGNYGGLAGADAHCQARAAAVGLRKTWHAYLSTIQRTDVSGSATVHAKDRVGSGPWYDVHGLMVAPDVATLHAMGPISDHMWTETLQAVPYEEHDIVTGSSDAGEAIAMGDNPADPPQCRNWTSSDDADNAEVGHWDWSQPPCADPIVRPCTGGPPSWNASHESEGCSEAGLRVHGSSGRLYCFAID